MKTKTTKIHNSSGSPHKMAKLIMCLISTESVSSLVTNIYNNLWGLKNYTLIVNNLVTYIVALKVKVGEV